jgi:hypothetical protein
MLAERHGIPRRNRMDFWSPGECAIQGAVNVVEGMGADVRLTDAVILLGKAREAVADFVDALGTDAKGLCVACGRQPSSHRFDCPNHPIDRLSASAPLITESAAGGTDAEG